MEDIKNFKSLRSLEWLKLTDSRLHRCSIILISICFFTFPWLTMRNFEASYQSYSYYYLDESVFNFVINQTIKRNQILLFIACVWLFNQLFLQEPSSFFRKNNSIFKRLIYAKAALYISLGSFWVFLSWLSTLIFYQVYCLNKEFSFEPISYSDLIQIIIYTLSQWIGSYPLFIAIFLVIPSSWQTTTLSLILFLSFFVLDEWPYNFFYSIHQPSLNDVRTGYLIITSTLLIIGIWIYYRNYSNKTYVYP